MDDKRIQAYLDRIGYAGDTAPTAQALRDLQFAHLRTVPYENLDIVRGIPLSLEIDALYDKIVTRRRGGYCFELNALYAWLLRSLGFEVVDYFARFLLNEPAIPKRRHHVLGVTIPSTDERYLSDVGVGVGSPNHPVKLEYSLEQPQGELCYRLDLDAFLGWVLKMRKQGVWKSVFSFTEEPQLPVDYVAISYFCEHADASPFNKAPMVAIRTEAGRNTLDGDTFKRFEGDQVTAWQADSQAAHADTLRTLFGIVL